MFDCPISIEATCHCVLISNLSHLRIRDSLLWWTGRFLTRISMCITILLVAAGKSTMEFLKVLG